MSRYAATTDVSSARSKAEIEATVERYGATQFLSGWSNDGQAVIGFTMEGRQVRFLLSLPNPGEKEFTHHAKGPRAPEAARKAYEQAIRQKWRALALVIKAKLEAVDSGITVFENEFLANIVLPGGKLVGDLARPTIALAYQTRELQPLLPDYSDTGEGRS